MLARDRRFSVEWTHRVRFTRDIFAVENQTLRSVIRRGPDEPRRGIVCVDDGLLHGRPNLLDEIRRHMETTAEIELVGAPVIVPGGEHGKNDPAVLHRLLEAIHAAGLCRRSYVLAVGGGAMLDVTGYAAAIAHRGIRLIRIPTTTLAQDDSGVGVKNGINAFNKKNFLGMFAPPWAVINDPCFLTTQSDRDWISGLSEAVKVALIKDAEFFEVIESRAADLVARRLDAIEPIIRRCAELHLEHIVSGDPFELNEARPLDFGHWAAHKLESITHFSVKHGEAVAIGIALDVEYARRLGWLAAKDAERIHECLRALGFRLWHEALRDANTLLTGLEEFREHLGGRLTISMLKGIGRSFEIHEVDADQMRAAIDALAVNDQEREAR